MFLDPFKQHDYQQKCISILCFLIISIANLPIYASNYEGVKLLQQGKLHKAFQAFQLTSEQGNAEGYFNLADMYALKSGPNYNLTKAIYYYKLAAQSGVSHAMTNLGYIYATGPGVIPINKQLAIKWYLKAIDHGDDQKAGRNLADLYYNEKPSNFKKARYYYWLSARQGNGVSLYKLGLMALKGQGEPAKLQQAYDYLYKAKLAGIRQATIEIKKLESKLTATQQQQLQEGIYQSQIPRPTKKTMKTVAQP